MGHLIRQDKFSFGVEHFYLRRKSTVYFERLLAIDKVVLLSMDDDSGSPDSLNVLLVVEPILYCQVSQTTYKPVLVFKNLLIS